MLAAAVAFAVLVTAALRCGWRRRKWTWRSLLRPFGYDRQRLFPFSTSASISELAAPNSAQAHPQLAVERAEQARVIADRLTSLVPELHCAEFAAELFRRGRTKASPATLRVDLVGLAVVLGDPSAEPTCEFRYIDSLVSWAITGQDELSLRVVLDSGVESQITLRTRDCAQVRDLLSLNAKLVLEELMLYDHERERALRLHQLLASPAPQPVDESDDMPFAERAGLTDEVAMPVRNAIVDDYKAKY